MFLLFLLPFCCTFASPRTPIDLVTPQRADLMAKYLFAKHRAWGAKDLYAEELYYRHLQAWNQFREDDPRKNCYQDYFLSYTSLLDSIKQEGFRPDAAPLPLSNSGSLLNGAHRLAACLLYDKPVNAEETEKNSYCWDLKFFKKKGLPEKDLDAMALQYCELKNNTYVMIVYPCAKGHAGELRKTIKKYARIVYNKPIFFTKEGGLNLVLHAYEDEALVQHGHAKSKAKSCFPSSLLAKNPARVYLLEAPDLNCVVECKREIRKIFHLGHHSVHTTDTHRQAIILARALFNKNSVHFLNHKTPGKTPRFDALFDRYAAWLLDGKKNEEWFCVDSGAALACYGLRDCSDLDFLHFEEGVSGVEDVNGHNEELKHHAFDKDTILFDPDCHFYYKGIKFCALDVVKAMKQKRKEKKDREDIALIDECLKKPFFNFWPFSK